MGLGGSIPVNLNDGPPVHVLLARVVHQLEAATLSLRAGDLERTLVELDAARPLLTMVQRKVK